MIDLESRIASATLTILALFCCKDKYVKAWIEKRQTITTKYLRRESLVKFEKEQFNVEFNRVQTSNPLALDYSSNIQDDYVVLRFPSTS